MTALSVETSIRTFVLRAMAEVAVTDMHTHLYAPEFGRSLLRGIDALLTYHYLIAETMRSTSISYDDFWALPKTVQADIVWKTLFIERSPLSESCRGVLTVLDHFGLDTSSRNLDEYREFFKRLTVDEHIDRVFALAGIESLVMTNDPFDEEESRMWCSGVRPDPRFRASLRIDLLLNDWESARPQLVKNGYIVREKIDKNTASEVRRFLNDWLDLTDSLYLAASMPPEFEFPEHSPRGQLIEECVMPVARERSIPTAFMIGVRRQCNPALRDAGDSMGKARIETVERLCADFPDNRFMITMLCRENQHELSVTARKFRNLMVFGCWWFMNNPSLIEETTRMRVELLGESIIPQHSDSRILDQLIYKWSHSREIIAGILVEKYSALAATGWEVSEREIRQDIDRMFSQNFWNFIGRPKG